MTLSSQIQVGLPYKSVAIALLFSVLLGPIGLLYGSFWGGFAMVFVGLVVISSKYMLPVILLWLICCIWNVGAVESYNRQLLTASQQRVSS